MLKLVMCKKIQGKNTFLKIESRAIFKELSSIEHLGINTALSSDQSHIRSPKTCLMHI